MCIYIAKTVTKVQKIFTKGKTEVWRIRWIRARSLSNRCAKSPRDIASRVTLKNLNAAFGLAEAKFKLNRGAGGT